MKNLDKKSIILTSILAVFLLTVGMFIDRTGPTSAQVTEFIFDKTKTTPICWNIHWTSLTWIINISWTPAPVNCNLEEKGVINVQPEAVCVAFEHLTVWRFLRFINDAFVVKTQKDSGIKYNSFQYNNFHELKLLNVTLASITLSRSVNSIASRV